MSKQKQTPDELWMEFLVPVRGSDELAFCGLCGNHGIVRIGQERTPVNHQPGLRPGLTDERG